MEPGTAAVRAVIDTSFLVKGDLRADLQQNARIGAFTAVWSPWITAELVRVLTWKWIERDLDVSIANWRRCSISAKKMMGLLITTFEVVAPAPPYPAAWESFSDTDDHPIWAAAKAGVVQYVVSENTRHFPPRGQDGRCAYEGIEYLQGQDFLDRLAEGIA
jgi:hypothetical protein